jgi:hypothetical protein
MAVTKYNADEIWPAIFEKISTGRSLASVLREPGMMSYELAKLHLRSYPHIKARYYEATRERAESLAEEIEQIADEPIPEHLDGPSKSAWIQRQRLRVDSKKWIASKLLPERFGDKIEVTAAPSINMEEAIRRAEVLSTARVRQTIEGEILDRSADA